MQDLTRLLIPFANLKALRNLRFGNLNPRSVWALRPPRQMVLGQAENSRKRFAWNV